jgi:hypothetical protein
MEDSPQWLLYPAPSHAKLAMRGLRQANLCNAYEFLRRLGRDDIIAALTTHLIRMPGIPTETSQR